MVKRRTSWHCSECGHKQARWSGQCPTCGVWNSLSEEVSQEEGLRGLVLSSGQKAPLALSEIPSDQVSRYHTGFQELDRVLGGGVVAGSLILLGGDPGIGKSTISLQMAAHVAAFQQTVIYISGEESLEQIALRARRVGVQDSLLFFNDTDVEKISKVIEEFRPQLVIVDSIQILFHREIPSSLGSITQVRECTSALMRIAKSSQTAIVIIGHVTKSGEIAGPKVLEHLVDTVLYFEGEQQQNLRFIRSIKNRFGPTDELAVFQMSSQGLQEVVNPSLLFIEDRVQGTPGTVVMPMIEGSRPMMVEAQALVTDTFFQTPSRRCTGFDSNRLALLLAVCEKRARLRLHQSDVFVSVTGGIRVSEPAADLGFLLSVVSSFMNKVFDADTTVIGEVGLGGEVRAVSRIETRIKEAMQMGFTTCLIPQKNMKAVSSYKEKVRLVPVRWVDEAIDLLL